MIPSGIRFSLTDFVVVSDAGLMSRTNIRLLKSAGYKFILGGRIKKEAGVIKDWLFSLNPQDGVIHERLMGNEDRIIVSYSAKRASKDAKWDGWKSYVTNTECQPNEVISQYRGLWVVERAFRVSKGTLESRPMSAYTCRL